MSKVIAVARVWAWIGRDTQSVVREGPTGVISWARMKIQNKMFDRFGQCLGGMLRLEHMQTPVEVKELLEHLRPGESHEVRITIELKKR
ncbi:hypothetical protein KAW64_16675 [bacterium]|nr:hypothetical protein [bacterium]